MIRLGVVSFYNSRPLIHGLEADSQITLRFDVPSRLAARLHEKEVDAALVPVVDYARAGDAWQTVSDACIACDGPTLTVRVFARRPAEQLRRLHVDGDSHTSVVLARLLWERWFARPVEIVPYDVPGGPDACEAVLLIGDKVVQAAPRGFPYQIDLGQAWKDWTGLPFVFAVWAARASGDWAYLARRLSEARDRGTADPAGIAQRYGPALGWPVALAEAYVRRFMRYVLTPEARAGMERFVREAQAAGCVPAAAWRGEVRSG